MATPFTMEWRLITNGEEKRVQEDDDIFEITFEGYKLFPVDETVNVMRKPGSNQQGAAKVLKLVFENRQTICRYQLLSLHSVN
ncbi:DUF2584 family protein [Piscibacillus salipiscarius]|uniref:DUF2584 family protein n=1 Tax=Piscibacillus salipiscarius TaxID=299480 RepID=A0ABW5QEY9_9BACI|nr:DUF2584 family protein [Piscibacillus salipiscarius]